MIARRKPVRKRKRGKVAATRRKLNLMWSEIIRRSNGGRCWMAGDDHFLSCIGPRQAAHCFGKKAMPAVRYELWNGVPLCARHHTYYTHNVERWSFILLTSWGSELYAERYRAACARPNHDYAAIEAELAAALEQVA